jgi:hypothetical protein
MPAFAGMTEKDDFTPPMLHNSHALKLHKIGIKTRLLLHGYSWKIHFAS